MRVLRSPCSCRGLHAGENQRDPKIYCAQYRERFFFLFISNITAYSLLINISHPKSYYTGYTIFCFVIHFQYYIHTFSTLPNGCTTYHPPWADIYCCLYLFVYVLLQVAQDFTPPKLSGRANIDWSLDLCRRQLLDNVSLDFGTSASWSQGG